MEKYYKILIFLSIWVWVWVWDFSEYLGVGFGYPTHTQTQFTQNTHLTWLPTPDTSPPFRLSPYLQHQRPRVHLHVRVRNVAHLLELGPAVPQVLLPTPVNDAKVLGQPLDQQLVHLLVQPLLQQVVQNHLLNDRVIKLSRIWHKQWNTVKQKKYNLN